MAEEIKFTEEEVKQIEEITTQSGMIYQQIGQLEAELKRTQDNINNAKNEMFQKLSEIKENETKLFTSLNEKYGDGNYNPETNIFTPIEQ